MAKIAILPLLRQIRLLFLKSASNFTGG